MKNRILIKNNGDLYTVREGSCEKVGKYTQNRSELFDLLIDHGISKEKTYFKNGINLSGPISFVYLEVDKNYFVNLWNRYDKRLKERGYFLDSNDRLFSYVLSTLNDEVVMKKNEVFYRSRIKNNNESFEDIEKNFGAPNIEKCNAGRLNPQYVKYLYLSDDSETSIHELRPWIGAEVWVARASIKEDNNLILKDFLPKDDNKVNSNDKSEIEMNEIKKLISSLFSKPVSSNKKVDYLITQCIAEYIRDHDRTKDGKQYDGIRYASSAHKGGYNIVIFNPELIKIHDKIEKRVKVKQVKVACDPIE